MFIEIHNELISLFLLNNHHVLNFSDYSVHMSEYVLSSRKRD